MSTESDYVRLRQLLSQVPDLTKHSEDAIQWLGKASALVEAIGGGLEAASFNALVDNMGMGGTIYNNEVRRVKMVLARMLAKAEQAAPVTAAGQFIAVGEPFSTLQAFTKLLETAEKSLLIVDPYIDQSFLHRYAGSVGTNVAINLLGANGMVRWSAGLKSALEAWTAQYGEERPVQYRCLPKEQLHDRVIVIDGGAEVWSVGQSIKDMGDKSPTVLDRLPDEVAALKGQWWQRAFNEASLVD